MGSVISGPDRDREQKQEEGIPVDDGLFRQDVLVSSLLETQARLKPSGICIVSSSAIYDFSSLLSLAMINAKKLSRQGVTKGSRVAIVSESSPASIVALLAVLQIGAVAVPLSASLPEFRLKEIVQIGGLTHLVALTALSKQVCLSNVQSIGLDLNLASREDDAPDADLITIVDPQAPAVIVFTSGSTGVPKGVVHSHASLSTMALAVGKGLSITPDERNLLFPSFGWAVNVIDTLSTLAAGACLCIPTEAEKSQGLEDTIRRFKATRTTMPPSVLRIMDPRAVTSLTSIVLAGEPMQPDVARAWSSQVSLYWNYGSSETLMVLAGKITEHGRCSLNVGHALSCCHCYIVDDNGRKMGPGQVGQLMIESYSNFKGYLVDGKVCEPDRGLNGCVVVSSGDFFERDSRNGAFSHRGRIDSQLKISGQRFEPQEVENKLWPTLTGVKELAVTAATLKGSSGGPALVALMVLDPDDSNRNIDQSRLTCAFDRLIETLPSYMIPIGGLEVKKLLRLHNGKLDRKNLIQMVEQRAITELIDLRPRREDRLEECDMALTRKVSTVWANVLGLKADDIKSSSNFFLLGGNSIDAMRACKALGEISIPLCISSFFIHPTVGEMVGFIAEHVMSQNEKSQQLPQNPVNGSEIAVGELHEMAAKQCGISEQMIEDVYPCTAMQAGLMTLSEMQEGAYIAEHTFQLPSSWRKTDFIHAWERVVNDVAILRSRIVRHESGVLYNATIRFDKSNFPPLDKFSDVPSMACGTPLFLHCLDTTREGDGLLWRWQVHHAVYDRTSTAIILKMLQKEYNRLGTTITTPFSKFAGIVTQQEQSEQAKDFWQSRLESFSGSVFPQLPLNHQVCRASTSIDFDCSIHRRSSKTTQATSIQGALAIMMSKMHGESDIIFGMTVHGRALRNCPESEMVVGPTIATVPVRIQLDGRLKIHEFLQNVQTKAALMSDYEHYGLQNMKLIGPGSTSAASFTTLLIVQSDLEHEVDDGSQRIIEIKSDASDHYLDYPLVFECFPHSDGIKVKMIYDPVVFSSWNVQMMAKQFEQLLKQIEYGADPSLTISDLNLVDHESVAEVLQFSCSDLIEHEECLHERIFAKAKAWETAEALCGWDVRYTYTELIGRVRALATYFSQHIGCSPAKIVPICYEKSATAVVAMLTVLSAGHGFLLIDPTLPAQRIKYMIDAVKADKIICSPANRRYVEHIDCQLIDLENIIDPKASLPESPMHTQSSPETPAYCIFTSGSTGSPKGVLLLHKQVTSGLEAQCNVGLYRRESRILQFASYSFDTCIADIFATLLTGGCICVPKDEDRLTRISENINEFSVNTIDLTPSVARMIQPDDVPKLDVLRLGGEAMHSHHIQTWANRFNLQNTYGPTECCVQCTFVDHVQETMSPLVIGKGIGCNTWVVDPKNYKHLMPLGAVGELAIQGPAIASGYINSLEKSKASFLPRAPWLETYNVECDFPTYLTGDLVKFNEEGSLVFLGRRDNQIKIRGQRVEPEGIEHILQEDQFVDQAVVCFPSTGVFASELVAVLEPPQASLNGTHKLSDKTASWMETTAKKASEFLPQHMVPTVYLLADNSLLMSSGKLDRGRMRQWLEKISTEELKSLKVYQRHKESHSTAPMADLPEALWSPVVEQVRYLLSWRSANSQGSISIRDSFSRIGLDSLTIVPLLRWVNKTYQAEISMQTLLRLGTIYELVCHLHRKEGQAALENGLREDHEGIQDIISKAVDQLCLKNLSSDPPRKVLLTGGSSLVGLHILTALLHEFSSTNVVVLMRCADPLIGKKRLVEKLRLLSSWENAFANRIEIWPGDLSRAHLGLSSLQWLQLRGHGDFSTHIDAIIHNGAAVDWFEGFQTLKKVNVDAALKLVECVRDSPTIKRLVYVSGGPQWDPDEAKEAVLEMHGLKEAFSKSNAYGQTKMITSAIIQQAAARNPSLAAKLAVIRPALIIGSSMDGVPNIDDFIWRVVRGCYSIRAFPRECRGDWVYLCGADRFAKMVIETLSAPPRVFETRVDNGISVEKFWQTVNQELGGQLECLEYSAWLQRLKAKISTYDLDSVESHPCQEILHMIESSSKVLGSAAPHSVNQKWRQRMEEESSCVVQKNIRYMADIGCFSKTESTWAVRVFNRTKIRGGLNVESTQQCLAV